MWRHTSLGDVCEKITDGSHNPPKGIDHSDFFMLSSKNVLDGEINFDRPRYLSEHDFHTENKRTEVRNGDVLLTIVGTVGRCAVVEKMPKYFTLQRSVAVLKPKHDVICSKFLMFTLQNMVSELNDGARGVAQKGIYLKAIKKLSISLPPLAEQQRIVAKLDSAFAEIDRAIEIENENSSSAVALVNAALSEIFVAEGENWNTKPLAQTCLIERGSSPRPIKSFLTDGDGVNWIKIGDTDIDGKYVRKTNQKITHEGAKKSRHVRKGDFILTNSMSYGRPYIMDMDGCIHDGWFVLQLKDEIDTEYYYYLLASPYVQNQFHNLAAGAVVKNISSDLVKKTMLPIPPKERQIEIRNRIIEIEGHTKGLAEIHNEKCRQLLSLKSAILAQELRSEAA